MNLGPTKDKIEDSKVEAAPSFCSTNALSSGVIITVYIVM